MKRPGRGRTPRGSSDEFWTPRDIIAELERRNGAAYAVDFAANAKNSVAPNWICAPTNRDSGAWGCDALAFDWAAVIGNLGGPGWYNPPFSKPNLPLFTAKAFDAAPRLLHPLDGLLPVSPRAAWFRRVWEGDVVGGHAINHGPLRGQVLRFDCIGYTKEVIFFGYAVPFLENGKPTDSALGSHCIVRLASKESYRRALARTG